MIDIGIRGLVAAVVLSATLPAAATSQEPERIVVDGQRYEMLTQPLHQWMKDADASARLKPFRRPGISTALRRGYRGTWAIRDGALYLFALDNRGDEAPDGAVPADWYTGQLVIGQGEWTRPPGYGWNGKYERYLLIDVRAGRVLSQKHVSDLKQDH